MPNLNKKISNQDLNTEGLLYSLLNQSKNQTRVRIPKELLRQVKAQVGKQTQYSFKITNRSLVLYALLNLLNSNVKNDIRYRLDNKNKDLALSKMLAIQNDPRNKSSQMILHKIDDLQNAMSNITDLTYGSTNALSWLIASQMGFGGQVPRNINDVYGKLRNDDIKPIIDEVKRAGINERDRQRHLD